MMVPFFQGVGNLGGQPVSKMVRVDDETVPVVEMRVYFPRQMPDGNGGFTEKGGFWRNVSIWRAGLGQRAMDHLHKGTRVFVRGAEREQVWPDEDGVERVAYGIIADYVALDFLGIKSVTFSRRSDRDETETQDSDEEPDEEELGTTDVAA